MLKPLAALASFCLFCLVSTAQPANSAAILARKQVPVLCYHQIRNWRASDKQVDKDYIIPPATFKAHMKMLADSGYHPILPDELYNYLTTGAQLPAKPIMMTFDDTDCDQFELDRPELMKHGFKGVYFITTTDIGKNRHYMDKNNIKQLSDEGNTIACHTQDHTNFKKYKGNDWYTQIDKPTKKLETITGKQIKYFAFPFGEWNAAGLPELHKRGFKAAFQLTSPRDSNDPIMTIRRLLGCGYWSAQTLDYNIKHDFGRVAAKKVVLARVK